MFTPKANSKQKRAKKTQEHETGYVVKGSSRENSIFHPKTQFSSTFIPNLLETQPRTSFIYEFHGLSTLLTSNSTSSTINYPILNPNSQILMNNNQTTC